MKRKSYVKSMSFLLVTLSLMLNGCGNSPSGASSIEQLMEAYKVATQDKNLDSIQEFIYLENIPKNRRDIYKQWAKNPLDAFEYVGMDYTSIEDGAFLDATQVKIVGTIVTQIKAPTDVTTAKGKLKKGEPMNGPSILIGCKNDHYYIIFERDEDTEAVYRALNTKEAREILNRPSP